MEALNFRWILKDFDWELMETQGRYREMQGDAGRCREMQADVESCSSGCVYAWEMQGDARRCLEMQGDTRKCRHIPWSKVLHLPVSPCISLHFPSMYTPTGARFCMLPCMSLHFPWYFHACTHFVTHQNCFWSFQSFWSFG